MYRRGTTREKKVFRFILSEGNYQMNSYQSTKVSRNPSEFRRKHHVFPGYCTGENSAKFWQICNGIDWDTGSRSACNNTKNRLRSFLKWSCTLLDTQPLPHPTAVLQGFFTATSPPSELSSWYNCLKAILTSDNINFLVISVIHPFSKFWKKSS